MFIGKDVRNSIILSEYLHGRKRSLQYISETFYPSRPGKLSSRGRQLGIGAVTDLKKLTGGIVGVVLPLLALPFV